MESVQTRCFCYSQSFGRSRHEFFVLFICSVSFYLKTERKSQKNQLYQLLFLFLSPPLSHFRMKRNCGCGIRERTETPQRQINFTHWNETWISGQSSGFLQIESLSGWTMASLKFGKSTGKGKRPTAESSNNSNTQKNT